MRGTGSLLIIILFTGLCFAQKPFQGTIVYKLNVEGDTSSAIKNVLPTYSYKFYKSDVILRIEGGELGSKLGDFLIKGESGKTVMLKRFDQIRYTVKAIERPAPTVTRLNDTLSILGYKCRKYKIINTDKDGTATQFLWATTDLTIQKPKVPSDVLTKNGLFIKGVEGVPLKIETTMIQSGVSITLICEAKKVTREKLNKRDFLIPEDYSEKEFDRSKFGL